MFSRAEAIIRIVESNFSESRTRKRTTRDPGKAAESARLRASVAKSINEK